MKKIILISANSDIGTSLTKHFLEQNAIILGTYRKKKYVKGILNTKKLKLLPLDLSSKNSINIFCKQVRKRFNDWETIIFCNGDLNPIGKFTKIDFKKWEKSIHVNCLSVTNIISQITKNNKKKRNLIFFAGGGTNNAVSDYSAYTLSKIFLIKFTELIAFEEKKIRTCILGPGWVNTRIHKPTLNFKEKLKNKSMAKKVAKRDDRKKMLKINRCVDWILNNIDILSGRNISLDHDNWGEKKLLDKLKKNNHIYKLRRFGN